MHAGPQELATDRRVQRIRQRQHGEIDLMDEVLVAIRRMAKGGSPRNRLALACIEIDDDPRHDFRNAANRREVVSLSHRASADQC